jgi:hypothetical protein
MFSFGSGTFDPLMEEREMRKSTQGRVATRRRRSAIAVVALVAIVAAVTAVSGLAASSVTPGSVVPAKDPFYTAPANIATYAPGQIVASRSVTISTKTANSAWQISYRSNDSHGNANMDVTTLIVPTAKWTGTGTRPAVTYEQPEDSTGTQCSPSYTMAKAKGASGDVDLNTMLSDGWAVQDPDYEGPLSAWLAGPQAGHAVLDGIRAADAFAAGGLSSSTRWGIDGYSGGANASAWAAQLAPTYAPSLDIAGVAIGGTPADPKAVAEFIDGTAYAGFEAAAAWGINEDYPEMDLAAIENAKGAKAINEVGGECLAAILTQFVGAKLANYTTVSDPLDYSTVAPVLAEDTVGNSAPTSAPIYDYHADGDMIVPVTQDNTLVSNWCGLGATIDEVRDTGGNHIAEEGKQQTNVESFLSSMFAGATPTNTC